MADKSVNFYKAFSLGIGWIGIIVAIIGFLYYPLWLGISAIVLGAVALTGPAKGVPATSVGLGIIVLIWPLFN
ncbi:hypothetical protein ACFO3D_18095 [Virgibacillus kekensis]|uniref:C4-dicarboxylate ABC transporter n=1 Tax=Virgibacillus kekensis TaxID=202261 RepID=A0ABV9DQK5_9BACI